MTARNQRRVSPLILLALLASGCTLVLPFEDYPPRDASPPPDARPDGGDASAWCEPDAMATCYTGEASSLGEVCHAGQKTCTSYHIWGLCEGEVTPAMKCAGRECGGDSCGGKCGTCEGTIVCETSSGICLRDAMQPIDATQFSQGSLGTEEGHQPDEDAHLVTLTPYEIDRYEVTNQAYLQCVQDASCLEPDDCDSGIAVWQGGGFPADKAHHPVVCVSWAMAAAYCAYVEKRLCTEAEWERACVYDATHRAFPWSGEMPGNPQYLVNCDDSYCLDAYPGTAPVGSFPDGKTAEGALFDMAGNVSEWVIDWYASGYYPGAPEQDPRGPCDGASPCEARTERVHRGGSFLSTDLEVRCARRQFETATQQPAHVGIRCCRDATGL